MGADQLEPGTLLNERYRILRVIGKGGMGTVYLAEHVRLDTLLAVKEVFAPRTDDADAHALLQQCEHEARFLVRLHHPNLPQVTDAFLENERFFVVMEYIEGVTLEARERQVAPGRLPVSSVIEWGLQIADVLAYLHSQDPPIIFRDLKPSNVMLQTDGRIRLIDFGIARRFQPGAVKDTNLLGSVGYSPPEQFGRHQSDTRTDIYSFGATLHNLLTGADPSHAPFKFASAHALNPAVPESLAHLIEVCLRLDAEARPQSIHRVAMELLAIRDTLPVEPDREIVPMPAESPQPAEPPSGANIILTNPTLRSTGKTQRGSQRVGSGGLASERSASSQRTAADANAAAGVVGPVEVSPRDLPRLVDSPSTGRNRLPLWVGAVAAVVLVGGGAAWMLTNGSKGARPVHRAVAPAPPGAPAGTGADPSGVPQQPVAPQNPPAVTPSDTVSLPITSPTHSVTFESIVVKGVTLDSQGHGTLRIEVAGTAEGQPGDEEIIAAFFYDDQNAQIASQLPQSPYSSRDGKLSAAATLALSIARQPFDLSLDIPLAAFPIANLTSGVQFHCVAFFGEQRIGESRTFTPVAPGLLSPPSDGQSTPGTPTGGGGANGGATGPARPPGTFSSAPMRSGD